MLAADTLSIQETPRKLSTCLLPMHVVACKHVQDKQKKEAAAAAAGKPKQSAGELRLNKGKEGASTYSRCLYTRGCNCCAVHAQTAVAGIRQCTGDAHQTTV